jgi:hypothetical protein
MVILGTGNRDWSIKKLFGIGLSGACPLATMSNIYIEITLNEVCYLTDLHVLAALFVHFLKTAVSDKFWACQIIIFPCTIIIF